MRVLHDQRMPVVDAVTAEGEIPRDARLLDADPRLEPLVVGVDERDERDLGPAKIGSETRHVVEGFFGRL